MDVRRTAVAVGLGIVLIGIFFVVEEYIFSPYPEVRTLSSSLTFDEYASYFESLAQERGGAYAFEVLRRADINPHTDLHLLGHVIGDVLYVQEGVRGIEHCTQDFRNACSHSIVVGLFTERGLDALDEISSVCREAPGGRGSYTMCFHGLGHGVLAYTLYDFKDAITICGKTATHEYAGREAVDCVGGAVMELVGGGAHDPRAWQKAREIYLKNDDPLYPCSATFLPEAARQICYSYITPRLFEVAGGDLAHPTEDDYARAFLYCDSLPEEQTQNRDACFGGLGKEFVVLAHKRDIRDLGSMSENDLRTTHSWCELAPHESAASSCRISALHSLFWGGENTPDASFTFCSIAPEEFQSRCFTELGNTISFFFEDNPFKARALCERIPSVYQPSCMHIPAL